MRRWSRLGIGGERIAYRQGSFWYRRADRIYNVWEADPDTRRLRGVRVYELDPGGRLLRAIRASSVDVKDGERWEFTKPVVHTFRAGRPELGPRIELLPSLSLEVGSQRDLQLLSSQASGLGLAELFDSIAAKREAGRPVTRDLTLLQRRLSEPLACLLLALLAIPVGFGVERSRNLAVSALWAILWLAAFQATRVTGNLMLSATSPIAALLPWLTLAIFSALGTRELLKVPR